MKILSIETSCDETGMSVLEIKKNGKSVFFNVLANMLHSQVKIHTPYGGVFPNLAKREHIRNLPILLEKALKGAKISEKDLDLIVVTSGPGLEPALWTGIVFAKELAHKLKIPLIPANHMEGHIFSVFAENKKSFIIPKIKFPTLSLLVSGGHTELVLIKNWRKYEIIGETLDDAAGEAFDKVARMLELPYPGGPEVSRLAEAIRNSSRRNIVFRSLGRSDGDGQRKFSAENFRADKNNVSSKLFNLPRPMMHSKNFDFSFSGLKTAVLYLVRDIAPLDDIKKKAIALEFENAVVETLVHKTKKAIEKYNIKTLIVAGGVSANKYLQKEIKKMAGKNIEVYFPNKKLTGDNALMVGIAGYFKYIDSGKKAPNPSKIKAEGGLRL